MNKEKEYGSDFYFPIGQKWFHLPTDMSIFSEERFTFFYSGRSALFHLLEEGAFKKGWKKIYIPSYYCHEVVEFIEILPITIEYYKCNPIITNEIDFSEIEDSKNNVLITICYFGIAMAEIPKFKNTTIIEDISHNILKYAESEADFCFGSLRKEIPIPLGGICFSPKKYDLPKGKESQESLPYAEKRLEGMRLKRDFLFGKNRRKSEFRELYQYTEEINSSYITNCALPLKYLAILQEINFLEIKKQKNKNVERLRENLITSKYISVNLTIWDAKNPFGIVLVCENNKIREALKMHLISQKIYPAILWPSQKNDLDKDLQNRILFVHADFRHQAEDIDYITTTMNKFCANEFF